VTSGHPAVTRDSDADSLVADRRDRMVVHSARPLDGAHPAVAESVGRSHSLVAPGAEGSVVRLN